MLRAIFYGLMGLLAAVLVVFLLNVFGMIQWSLFGQWGESIRYDIQKESQAYNDGLSRELDHLMRDLESAESATERNTINQIIHHKFSQATLDRLPQYQKDFLRARGIY